MPDGLVVARHPAGAEADLDPAPAQHVHRGQLLGQHDRVLVVVVEDEGADPQRGRGGGGRQRRHRRQLVAEMVGHGDRGVAEALDAAGLLDPARPRPTDRTPGRRSGTGCCTGPEASVGDAAARPTANRRNPTTGVGPLCGSVDSVPPARSLAWLARLGLIVGGGALLLAAVVVAVAPRVWQIANAHEELPVVLPAFQPLAQRSYAYDIFGNELAVFQAENSQPVSLEQVPPHVIDAFLAVEDREFYNHDGVNLRSLVRATLSNFSSDEAAQQGASTITMQVVKNDFLAGLERDGRYKLLQVHYALDARPGQDQGRDPRALLEHRLPGQQRLRHPGSVGGVLRQDGGPADVHRSGVPCRPRPFAVGLRPGDQPGAQPVPVRSRSSTGWSTPAS